MYIQLIKLETLFRNGEDKMMKKLLSMICALCTICMLFPTVIFAEGDKYDLWQVGDKIYYAESGKHTDFNLAGEYELSANLSNSGTYILQTDIDLTKAGYYITINKNITLDLNGKTVNGYYDEISFIIRGNINESSDFTIRDSSNGSGFITGGYVHIYDGSSLKLLSGTIAKIVNFGTFYAD